MAPEAPAFVQQSSNIMLLHSSSLILAAWRTYRMTWSNLFIYCLVWNQVRWVSTKETSIKLKEKRLRMVAGIFFRNISHFTNIHVATTFNEDIFLVHSYLCFFYFASFLCQREGFILKERVRLVSNKGPVSLNYQSYSCMLKIPNKKIQTINSWYIIQLKLHISYTRNKYFFSSVSREGIFFLVDFSNTLPFDLLIALPAQHIWQIKVSSTDDQPLVALLGQGIVNTVHPFNLLLHALRSTD